MVTGRCMGMSIAPHIHLQRRENRKHIRCHITFEALHSASPELDLTLYEFESASDCEWAMSNIAPHLWWQCQSISNVPIRFCSVDDVVGCALFVF